MSCKFVATQQSISMNVSQGLWLPVRSSKIVDKCSRAVNEMRKAPAGWGERGATAPLSQIARVLFLVGTFYFRDVSTI